MLSEILLSYLLLASAQTSTTYGWGERMCGVQGAARHCVAGEPTASGVLLDPDAAQAALPLPEGVRLPPGGIHVRLRLLPTGRCTRIHVTDTTATRWVGVRGFDLTRGALSALGVGVPAATWSGGVGLCPTKPIKIRLIQNKELRK